MNPRVLAAIERNRQRVWALCYRMTGRRADADDLAQESFARAIERAAQSESEDPTGWLLRIAATTCLDHLRRQRVQRRANELVDPLDEGEPVVGPEERVILREDVRFAVVVALQTLTPRQRVALVLRDVCDRSVDEVAAVLDTNANAVKALIHRAHVALADARVHVDGDVPADRAVIDRLAATIEAGAVERLAEMFAEDIWGVVDGGDVVPGATKPTFGRTVVARQWINAKRRLGLAVRCRIVRVNGEDAILVSLADAPQVMVALVHVETRAGFVRALRILRDPAKLAWLRVPEEDAPSSSSA